MSAGPVLTGVMIGLRPIQPRDAAGRFALVNDADSRRLTGAVGATDLPAVTAWCEQAGTRPGRIDWAVCAAGEDEYLGEISLVAINRRNDSADLRMSMRAEWRGRGYSTEAIPMVLAYAFSAQPVGLGLHRVTSHILSTNMRVQSLYETLGFVREGRLRHTHREGEKWIDTIVSSVLAEEIQPLK